MNKRTKKLIFAVSILVLLCVSYVFCLSKNNSSDSTEASSDSDNTYTTKLGDFNSSSITSISFNGISLTCQNGEWLYTEDSDYPVDNTAAALLADTLADLSYSDSIKKSDIEDLSVYGLKPLSTNESADNSSPAESPSYNNVTLEISFTADEAVHTYYIGTYNSITDGYYLTFDNDDYIYMVEADIINAFNYDNIYELLTTDAIPEIDATYMTGMAIITPETSYMYTAEIVSGEGAADTTNTDSAETDSAETGSAEADSAESGSAESDSAETSLIWYVQATDIASQTTGEKTAVDTDSFSTVVNNILTATVNNAVTYKPSDEELNAYGLSIPAYTIIITYISDSSDTEEKTFTLSVGAQDSNGNSYAIINNSQMIVSISGIALEALF